MTPIAQRIHTLFLLVLSQSHSSLKPTTPTSTEASFEASTPLTPSPQIPTFNNIIGNVFSKSLITSITSKDAVLEEVRYCNLTNNEARLKESNPYIHSYWRDIHICVGCVCIHEKIAIPNVLREALIYNLNASRPVTWGMLCMATHWWVNMNRELIAKSTKCKPCNVFGKNLKYVILDTQFRPQIQ